MTTKYVPIPDLTGVPDGREVARIAYDWLTEHPEQHDQDTWGNGSGARNLDAEPVKDGSVHCGTTCCIGGLIALADGWSWSDVMNGEAGDVEVPEHAARRLGLDPDVGYEADEIFFNFNEEAALKNLRAIAEGR